MNYFGPVSLNNFKVTLYTEDGYILNLNDRNWNFLYFANNYINTNINIYYE